MMGKIVRMPKPAVGLLRCPHDDSLGFLLLWDGNETRILCAECGDEIDLPAAPVVAEGPADP